MNKYIKHYAELYYFIEGSTGEKKIIEVPSRDEDLICFEPGLVSFRFYDRKVKNINGKFVVGLPENYSNFYYYGTKLSLLEIINIFGAGDPLVYNMKSYGATHVVRSFNDIYLMLPLNGKVLETNTAEKSNQRILK